MLKSSDLCTLERLYYFNISIPDTSEILLLCNQYEVAPGLDPELLKSSEE